MTAEQFEQAAGSFPVIDVGGLAGIERPLLVELGDLSSHIDWHLVRRICYHLLAGSVVFVGYRTDTGFSLPDEPPFVWINHDPALDMPYFLANARVIIAPYLDAAAIDPRIHWSQIGRCVPVIATSCLRGPRIRTTKTDDEFIGELDSILTGQHSSGS